jgi:hypothetical protein
MRFKGNQPLHETPRPDPDQKEVRYPREVKPEDFSTMEVIAERENEKEDSANVEELENTSQDFWGRSAQQSDGAVPSEPPDTDPLELLKPEKPIGPPAHNI